jgi:hypothetical protein
MDNLSHRNGGFRLRLQKAHRMPKKQLQANYQQEEGVQAV